MISLYDSEIKDILPEYLAYQDHYIAVSYAIKKAVKRLYEYCQRVRIYAAIDYADENVLDMLALDLNTQYYEESLNIDIKRSLIKSTLLWYSKAGTPAAVEELAQAVFGIGKISEWYEYGGQPYMFKIKTNAPLTPEGTGYFMAMIEKVKNARSHLEDIELCREIEQTLYAGTAYRQRYIKNSIKEGTTSRNSINQQIYEGIGMRPAYIRQQIH
ncbi:MAG: phage tail protein [Lachnospiraceae bacterium]|nr:phage tail protein [Lachnospiraceae bacterium]